MKYDIEKCDVKRCNVKKFDMGFTLQILSGVFCETVGRPGGYAYLMGYTAAQVQACFQTILGTAVRFVIGSGAFSLIWPSLAQGLDSIHMRMSLFSDRLASLLTASLSVALFTQSRDGLNRLAPKPYNRSGDRSYLTAIPI